ncbi:MAG: hypothetical protein HRU17_08495 [Polyangiaceae bacterium]|nr:hypothetical protein [Polyangiaceae bacterium]
MGPRVSDTGRVRSAPKRWMSGAVVMALLGLAPSAAANPLSYHEHDGFLLRLSLGAGSMLLERDTTGQAVDFDGSSSIEGGAMFAEIVLATTVWPGVAIGGSLGNYVQASPVLKVDTDVPRELAEELTIVLLGPTVEYYPWPSDGWNLAFTLGRAAADVPASPGSPVEKLGGDGWGASLAAGHEWWVGDEWSAGVRATMMIANLDTETRSEGRLFAEDDLVAGAALVFTLVYQ